MMLRSLSLALLLCVPPTSARACSCIERPPLVDASAMANEVARFAAILDGIVLAVDTARHGVNATIVVQRHWKGALADTVVVHTSFDGGTCGLSFTVGTRYLIFASRESLGWYATICSPSVSWGSEAERRVQLLGRPRSYSTRLAVTSLSVTQP